MAQFDYRVIKIGNKGPGQLEEQLNGLALEGFRLISVTSGKNSFAILERFLGPPEEDEEAASSETETNPEETARFFAEKAGWMREDGAPHWQAESS